MICSTACSVACISTQLKDYFILEFVCEIGAACRSCFIGAENKFEVGSFLWDAVQQNPVVQNWPIYQSKYLFVLKGRIRYN